MRIVHHEGELTDAYDGQDPKRQKAFGNDEIYVEKFIENPKHIEVKIIGDEYGNIQNPSRRKGTVQFNAGIKKSIEVALVWAS